jgi:hypothetical protein
MRRSDNRLRNLHRLDGEMEQKIQDSPDSRVWDDRASRIITEARKMPLGERRRAALREAGRLRIAAEINRRLATK